MPSKLRSSRTVGPEPAPIGRWPKWRFILTFGCALALYFLLTLTLRLPGPDYADEHPLVARLVGLNESVQHRFFEPYQRMIAASSAATVNLLGYDTTVHDREIRSPQFAVTVTHGCDGIELSLLLAAAIVAFPATVRRKAIGLGRGLGLIALLNYLRVVSLWIVGVHWRASFDFVHFNLWPLLLICSVLIFFVAWLRQTPSPVAVAPS